jgi:hypothetical protein
MFGLPEVEKSHLLAPNAEVHIGIHLKGENNVLANNQRATVSIRSGEVLG